MVFVNLLGVAFIALIVWWFWLYKPTQPAMTENEITIEVTDGVYTPSRINVKSAAPITLRFMRKDASPCAELVVFPELNMSENLQMNKKTKIELPQLQPGEYRFHCQMQMYRGTLIVSQQTE